MPDHILSNMSRIFKECRLRQRSIMLIQYQQVSCVTAAQHYLLLIDLRKGYDQLSNKILFAKELIEDFNSLDNGQLFYNRAKAKNQSNT